MQLSENPAIKKHRKWRNVGLRSHWLSAVSGWELSLIRMQPIILLNDHYCSSNSHFENRCALIKNSLCNHINITHSLKSFYHIFIKYVWYFYLLQNIFLNILFNYFNSLYNYISFTVKISFPFWFLWLLLNLCIVK